MAPDRANGWHNCGVFYLSIAGIDWALEGFSQVVTVDSCNWAKVTLADLKTGM